MDRALLRLRHRLRFSERTALSLGPIMAGLASVSRQTALQTTDLANAFKTSPRAVSISKGVSQMLIRSKIKNTAAVVVVTLALAGGVLLACSVGDKPPAASTAPSTTSSLTAKDRTCENVHVIVIVSADGGTLTGYSKNTGQWAQVTSGDFSIDSVVASDDVGVYCGKTAVYAFSPWTATWSHIGVPEDADPTKLREKPRVATGVAAIAFKGTVAAYSAITGTWDTLKVTENDPLEAAVSPNSVKVTSGDKIYIFASKTGKWSSGF